MNQREQVLAMLKQAGDRGVTTADFLGAYLPRFSARIKELRDEGHTIRTERLSQSSSRYIFVAPDKGVTNTADQHPSAGSAVPKGGRKSDGAPPVPSEPPAGLFDMEPEKPRPVSHYEWEAA